MKGKDIVSNPSSVVSRVDGFSRFNTLFEDLDRFWKQFDAEARRFSDLQPKSSFPKLNVVETDLSYEVDIALAGFNKDDIVIEFLNNAPYATLLIKAEKKEGFENAEDRKYLIKEISQRAFKRYLSFPKDVEVEKTTCTFENGIVKCVVLKKQSPQITNDTFKIEIK